MSLTLVTHLYMVQWRAEGLLSGGVAEEIYRQAFNFQECLGRKEMIINP